MIGLDGAAAAEPSPTVALVAARTPKPRYYFSLECELNTMAVGELSDGLRFHIDYGQTADRVFTDHGKYTAAGWLKGASVKRPEAKGSLGKAFDADKGLADRLREAVDQTNARNLVNAAAGQPDEPSPLLDRPSDIDTLDDGNDAYPRVLKAIRQLRLVELPKGVPDLAWYGVEGQVLSGAALATLRRDGVAIFETRVTMEAFDGYRIHGIFTGVIDFGAASYQKFAAKTHSAGAIGPTHTVKLAVRFEAAGKAPSYAANKYVERALASWKYEPLVRGQFVALGEVTLKDDVHFPAEKIAIDIYELTV